MELEVSEVGLGKSEGSLVFCQGASRVLSTSAAIIEIWAPSSLRLLHCGYRLHYGRW